MERNEKEEMQERNGKEEKESGLEPGDRWLE
jgi:hypothetical protein